MTFGYGNLGWQIFVYSAYIIVGVSLFIYIIQSIYIRNKSIQSLFNEGFLDPENNIEVKCETQIK